MRPIYRILLIVGASALFATGLVILDSDESRDKRARSFRVVQNACGADAVPAFKDAYGDLNGHTMLIEARELATKCIAEGSRP